MSADAVLAAVAFGALNASVYAVLLFLLASGLTVVFGMLGIMNIAHASFYMVGAYVAHSVTSWTGSFWASLLVVPIIVAALGMVVERTMLRRAHTLGHAHELLLTLGLAYIILELTKAVWGTGSLPFDAPPQLQASVSLFEWAFPAYRLFVIALGLGVLAALGFVLLGTRIGLIIRAAVSDVQMVDALGFNVRHLFVSVFGAGAYLAGLAGVVAAPILSVHPGMGADILVDCFIVVVVGGLGSLFGALVAAFLVACLQSFGVFFMPDLAMFLPFMLMAGVLVWRPMGLFGDRA